MNNVKTLLLVAMVLTAVTAVAGADDPVSSATGVITDYSKNKITRDAVKTELSNKYTAGTLTKADLKKMITTAYNHNVLKREDMRWLLGEMYKEGKLTRADLRWVLTEAYKNGELTRDDLRFIIAQAYKNKELTRADMKFLITEAYKAGELKRDDIAWIITHAYKNGELTREDMKWLIVEAYKAGELTRDDIREIIIVAYNHNELKRDDVKWLLIQAYKNNELMREDLRIIITAAYRHGELTRADVKWLIVEAYKAGELTRDDVRSILLEAIKRGELRKADVLWLVKEAYKANELTTSDITEAEVNSAPVEGEPADVPTVENITEPNAETASDATTAKTFDEESAPAPAESVIKTKQAWMLYKYALLPVEKHRIGMEAIIGYAQSAGKDASKLVTLKDKFVLLADQLKAAAEKNDYPGGKSIISQMKDTVTGFRTETKTLVSGNESAAKDALNAALSANSDYFDSLVTEAREARKDRNLEFFDLALARAQGRLDKAKENGIDVSALQAKLDEISSLRSDFVDSMNEGIAACTGEGLGKCTKPEVEAYKTVRDEIKNKYKELIELAKTAGQSQRFAATITKARDIIAKSETVLDAARKRGIDVSAESAGLDEIKGLVNSAESKYKAGDFNGAKDDLKKAQDKFKELKSSATSRRRAK
ncbi:MAG: hypothetical protein MPEBLZ_03670 [Candidatus Methanoperedens nitroreducens]|uniref:Uncharacterized protein n=1 Tax=Candidatus Methanoperedens nitratireducens TaxID=1392998 RepID=A0A0P7ZB47_9EURY|nr:hypothetical protein [Candidatus Methanoperedens sp. BLZ2]KAB2948059.1 MAG: hypothetical protein F9K14_02050 [Candidatus Methanoperedens sp.]KPQ41776.1 MAG: hypothetical protein MPEBLZ_03670 [Candidatus Methanoperedens sp. BLZ1]MBZ0173860.1 hypothetical protein [Candidatus Methanoperedens nitroreducens]CAG0971382.1 hypothetical protein METP2_01413 [Methanosarcinales archaeon]MCX9080129.1 hypothetical protein [Candidatus Methanoperedens sp.]